MSAVIERFNVALCANEKLITSLTVAGSYITIIVVIIIICFESGSMAHKYKTYI